MLRNTDKLNSMQVNQQNSPLLRLPAELRQMVYNFALDINSGATPLTLPNGTNHLTIKVSHNDYFRWSRWSFCRTSRQLFAETSKDYFEQKFIVAFLQKHVYGELEELERNIESLSLDQRRAFNKIRLDRNAPLQLSRKLNDACPLLQFSNLRVLSVRWNQERYFLGRDLRVFLRWKLGHNVLCYFMVKR
jgi:hypothetical protein